MTVIQTKSEKRIRIIGMAVITAMTLGTTSFAFSYIAASKVEPHISQTKTQNK